MWIKDQDGNVVNTAHLSYVRKVTDKSCKAFEAGNTNALYVFDMPVTELFYILQVEAAEATRTMLALEKLAGCVSNNGKYLDVITYGALGD
jgi:hypothetical protein